MCYHCELECNWERWQLRGTSHSPNLKHYWNLTISLISWTLYVCRFFTPLLRCSRCILQAQLTGQRSVPVCYSTEERILPWWIFFFSFQPLWRWNGIGTIFFFKRFIFLFTFSRRSLTRADVNLQCHFLDPSIRLNMPTWLQGWLYRPKGCPGNDTKLYLRMSFMFWRSEKCEIHFYCRYY